MTHPLPPSWDVTEGGPHAGAADWGGAIAWRVAAWYPEAVEKLVIMAGPHPRLFRRNMDAAQKVKCAHIP